MNARNARNNALVSVSTLTVAVLATNLSATACDSGGASSPSTPPPAVVTGCPATTGPTLHDGTISGDETWKAEAGPHIVTGDLDVLGKLKVEPCAEVRVAAGAHVRVGNGNGSITGTLVAEGTAERPITFAGDEGGRWASLRVTAPSTIRLAHLTIEGGGSDDTEAAATILGVGDAALPADPVLFADTVTVKGSRGPGVYLERGATFVIGSRELVVTDSGRQGIPYPVRLEETAIDALPTGRYTGNAKDEILLVNLGEGESGSGLTVDATLHDRGVPYHFGEYPRDVFAIGSTKAGSVATLTIEPGVVMKFEPESGLRVQAFESAEAATGAIRALGTPERPVVFTSASATPKAGDWAGLVFNGLPQASNKLDHVRIEYAGYWCSCSLVSCSDTTTYDGAIVFVGPPPRAFVTNSVFKEIAGHGITQGFDGSFMNFRPTNTFEGVTGCVQTLPRNADTTCPETKPACDGQ